MKKLILFILAGIFCINPVIAKHIDAGTAMQVAQNYIQQNSKMSNLNLALTSSVKSSKGIDDCYVFEIQNNTGFIIVSAEDAGLPVIGYSTESGYQSPSATSNPNFYYWMEQRKAEIEFIREHNIQPDSKVKNEWNRYSASSFKFIPPSTLSVGPLCSTTWNQNGGGAVTYNSQCPVDAGGPSGRCYVGCVATAMAQIMKKWAYPTNGIGSSSYSWASYGTMSANYAATTYNWASMPNGSSNADVAQLSYHCGVSVNMQYGPGGSGAYVQGGSPSAQYALVNYFGYSSSINCKYRATDPSWLQDLKTEFDNGRPVQYFGYNPGYTSGHSWVGDGYDASDNIHMNWGWGGFDNGYFAVNNLAPPGTGYDFSTGDGALFGIEPAVPNTQLIASHCGMTLTSMTQYINCVYVPGATDYRYRITHAASGFSTVYTKGTYHSYFQMCYVQGVGYSKTYNVEVAACKNGTWGSYSTVCTITTPAMPTTKIVSTQCGTTLGSMTQYINCDYVGNATDYRYRITHPASGFSTVYTKGTYHNYFQMSNVSGVDYSKTYNVEVAAYCNGTWGSYGAICTITTPVISTTQIVASQCGMTLGTMNQYINCVYIAAASDYRYRITHAASGFSTVYTKGTYHSYFQMSNVSGVTYAKTYNVEVAAQVNGVWGSYGSICTITTPALPTPKLTTAFCGATLSTMYQFICSDFVPGATSYEYRIANSGSGFSATLVKNTYITNYQMSVVPGVQYAKTYTVDVRAYINGAWGAYGAACSITTPLSPIAPNFDAERLDLEGASSDHSLVLSPNPVVDNEVNLSLSGFGEGNMYIEIMNVVGARMNSLQVPYSPGEILRLPVGNDLAPGIYFMNVSVNGVRLSQKFIVQHNK